MNTLAIALLFLSVCLLAVAIPRLVRALNRASQHVDAIRWDFQRSAPLPTQTDTTDPKENHAA
jgi:hypothetical protein